MTKEQARLIYHSLNNIQQKVDSLLKIFENAPSVADEKWYDRFEKQEIELLSFSMLQMQDKIISQLSFLEKDERLKEQNNSSTKQYYQWAGKELRELNEVIKKAIA